MCSLFEFHQHCISVNVFCCRQSSASELKKRKKKAWKYRGCHWFDPLLFWFWRWCFHKMIIIFIHLQFKGLWTSMFWSFCLLCKMTAVNLCYFERDAIWNGSSCCFRKRKQRQGLLYFQVCLCLLVRECVWVHSVFTIRTASPLAVDPVALWSLSRSIRVSFKGMCPTIMSDSSVCVFFFLLFLNENVFNELLQLQSGKTESGFPFHFDTSSPPTQKKFTSKSTLWTAGRTSLFWPLGRVHSPHSTSVSIPRLEGIFFFSLPLAVNWKGVVRALAVFGSCRTGHRCQEMSSPNRCFSHRICDKVYSRQLRGEKNKCCLMKRGDYHFEEGETERIYPDKECMKKTTTLLCVYLAKNVIEDF